MKVCKNDCRTPDEELLYIETCLEQVGNFLPFDVHPNVLRAANIRQERLIRKRIALIKSPEFLESS